MADEQRKTVFDDLRPAQESAVERLQFVGVMVLIAGIVGSGILHRLLHVDALLTVGIVFTVFALNVIIITVLVARVLGVSSLTVAREGVRSVGDDARLTLARARRRVRR
ncbi:MAG: hypothetical protein ABI862_21755 [Ilumatobacteraceae bacterium]